MNNKAIKERDGQGLNLGEGSITNRNGKRQTHQDELATNINLG